MTAEPTSAPPDGGPPPIKPDAGTTKTIGLLNIVFASLILVCGLCFAIQTSFSLAMGPAMEKMQADVKKQFEEQHQKEIEALKEQEEAAATEEEKETIQQQRADLEKRGPPPFPNTAGMFTIPLDIPNFIAYSFVDYGTGLILNILMIVAGIGLLRFREWARRVSLWVAGIKIVRLVCLEVFFIVAIIPAMSRKLGDMVESMMRMNPAAPPPPPFAGGGQMATIYAAMYTSMAVAMIVLGVIYPIVVLWFLNRPSVRLACQNPATLARQV